MPFPSAVNGLHFCRAAINEQLDGGDVAAVAGREEDNRFTIIQEAE